MTALLVVPSAVPSVVIYLVMALCVAAVALIYLDRRAVVGLVVACVVSGGLIAHDTTTAPKPDVPIYCPCSFLACQLGVCVPNHRMTAPDARQPWILR